ncbi:uncharacterized protein DSM5745_00724 [Aspergillus mulundensis]|uniref:Uncharacterized protein n=1 Tax=Aspergillus mulundensis TaxID=1810919 RepID=A0A3D8T4B4_9EURO|nr:hypothetical protein DSM5745_00724 [Aspergillus mulundensis]RDW93402.1 hypothetical protein DSM5745_00724 [Aspergillus mulundensis]
MALLIPQALRYLNVANSPSATRKAQAQEVASLLLNIYETLAEMRYLDSDSIQRGPHNITAIETLYSSNNIHLDPAIIYLYSILPYIGEPSVGVTDFFHGGTFIDFRDEESIDENRDPFYASPEGTDFSAANGPYMRPWMTALSRLGNHGSVTIYDAKEHRIWIIDQEGWGTTDPFFDGEELDQDIKEGTNRNSFEHLPSRPAGDVLRDINRWYRELVELPGGGEYSGGAWNDPEIDLRALYRKNGWPDAFDGDAFEVDKARAEFSLRARYDAEEPRRAVERFRDWRGHLTQKIDEQRQLIESARSMDEELIARFESWSAELALQRVIEEAETAEEVFARRCPGGVCFKDEELVIWEAELLRQEVKYKRRSVGDDRQSAKEVRESDPEHTRGLEVAAGVAEKEANVYQKAYEAAVRDAELLCPGKAFIDVSGRESLDEVDLATSITKLQAKIEALEMEVGRASEFARRVPDEADQARGMAEERIRDFEKRVEFERETVTRLEGWLAERGDEQ